VSQYIDHFYLPTHSLSLSSSRSGSWRLLY